MSDNQSPEEETNTAPVAEEPTSAAPTNEGDDEQASKKRRRSVDGEARADLEHHAPPADSSERQRQIAQYIALSPRQYLVDVIIAAAMKDDDLYSRLRNHAETDPSHRKLFLRGINWETSEETVMKFMDQYGKITEGALVTDRGTGRHKGYGFVTYSTLEEAQAALAEPSKLIDGRYVTCSLAGKRDDQSGVTVIPSAALTADPEDISQRKVFVRGLPWEVRSDELQRVYERYGEVEEAIVVFDRNTGQSRGFGFVIFRTAAGAKAGIAADVRMGDRDIRSNLAAEGHNRRSNQQQQQQQQQPGSQHHHHHHHQSQGHQQQHYQQPGWGAYGTYGQAGQQQGQQAQQQQQQQAWQGYGYGQAAGYQYPGQQGYAQYQQTQQPQQPQQ